MKKKFFSIALLAALLGTPLTQAQTAIPYTQDFESETSWPVSGWTSVGSGDKSVYEGTSKAHSGSKSLKFANSTSNIAIMPQFTSELANLQLEVWWKPETFSEKCDSFDLGYITDTTNAATFVSVKSVSYADYGSAYHKERLYFTSAPTGARIAFRARPTNSGYYWFIDDITVKALPTCYPVSDFAVVDVTTNSADITWTASGHGETQWQYVCDTVGFTPDWSKATLVSTDTASISGLNPNTSYEIYIRSYCSESDQSDPENLTFRTACVAADPAALGTISFEASEGFVTGAGNITNCWTVGNMQSNSSDYIPYVTANGSQEVYARTGNNCLKLKATNQYSKADSAYAVMPEMIYDGGITSYEVHFFMRKMTASASYNDTLYVGIVSDPTDLSDLQIVGYGVNNTKIHTQQIVTFENYTGGTTGYVVFLAAIKKPAASNTYGAFYVDDIEIIKRRLTTTPVVDSVVNITTTTADVAFSGSNATSYRIMAATESVSDPETYTNWAIDTTGFTTSPATINVQPATTYYLYMQGFGQDTSYISTPAVIFESDCEAVTTFPWKEDFNDMTYGNFSKVCWTNEHISGSGTKIAKIVTAAMGNNTTPQLSFDFQNSGTRTHVLTPEFNIPAADTYVFSIDVYRQKRSDTYPDAVRVITDKGAGKDTTVIPVDTATAGTVGTVSTEGWYTYTISLPNAGVQQVEILDINNNGYATLMDNFRVYDSTDSVTVVAKALENGSGTVEGSGRYCRGDEVTLTAAPAEHYHFVQWVEDGVTTPTRTFTASADTTYFTAQFDKDSFNITGLSADSVMGTVTGSGRFPYEYTVDLKAVANYGYHFTEWSNGEKTAAIFVTVKSDSTITANFAKNEYTVTPIADPDSLGSVYGAGTYNYLDTAMLVAVPDSGCNFTGWSNGEMTDTIYVVVTDDMMLTAYFSEPVPFLVAVNIVGLGSVTGQGNYNSGEIATLIATPGAGYRFKDWSNGETKDTIQIVVISDTTLTATFEEEPMAVENVENGHQSEVGTYKYLRDGNLYIRRDNVIYDAKGTKVE